MSKGFLILAQNSDVDYVRQAYALALSIKATQPNINNISIVTNDTLPADFAKVFDQIISIPFNDSASNSTWKVENRWKLYHASPYDETIIFDTDMLVLDNIEEVWKFVNDRDLFFTSSVIDYKNRVINNSTYRKMFVANDLPNLYSGMCYFRKSDTALEFFKLLEFITYNWEKMYYTVAPKNMQSFYSFDVSVAIAAKLMGIDDVITNKNSPFTFTHLKPALQGWDPVPESCLSQLIINFTDYKELYLNNFRQHRVVHYVEDAFLTEEIIKKLNV
jgi:hypothetical protein